MQIMIKNMCEMKNFKDVEQKLGREMVALLFLLTASLTV